MSFTITEQVLTNLSNQDVTLFINDVEASENDVIEVDDELKAVANNFKRFFESDGNPSIYFQEMETGSPFDPPPEKLYFDISNEVEATLIFVSGNWATLNVQTEQIPIPEGSFLINETVKNTLDSNRVRLYVDSVELGLGDYILVDDVVTAETYEDRIFFTYPDESGTPSFLRGESSIYFRWVGDGAFGDFPDGDILFFDLVSDTEAVLNYRDDLGGNGWDYSGSDNGLIIEVQIKQPTEVLGTNNVYLIDQDILDQVNKKRFDQFSDPTDDPGTSDPQFLDYGQFILSVLQIPFTIPEEIKLFKEPIVLANFNTEIEADYLKVDVFRFNLGSISVPETFNDLRDYENTIAKIHLPYVDSIAIELEYVIGHELTVEYLIDAYTGIATVNVISDRLESPVISQQVDIGVNVPFGKVNDNTVNLQNSSVDRGGDNGVKEPFIEIVRSESILSDGFFTIPIIDEDILLNHTGFLRVENVRLEVAASMNEKQAIISLLNNGIIINE